MNELAEQARVKEVQRTMLLLRNACREVADQYDEFGTVYQESLDGLDSAETAFWKASDTSEPTDGAEAMEMAVANAINTVQLFSRFNDWTSDRVDGFPVEICRHTRDDDIEVIARFPSSVSEQDALDQMISATRARAAIRATIDPAEGG